jgi:hypothetical protein
VHNTSQNNCRCKDGHIPVVPRWGGARDRAGSDDYNATNQCLTGRDAADGNAAALRCGCRLDTRVSLVASYPQSSVAAEC